MEGKEIDYLNCRDVETSELQSRSQSVKDLGKHTEGKGEDKGWLEKDSSWCNGTKEAGCKEAELSRSQRILQWEEHDNVSTLLSHKKGDKCKANNATSDTKCPSYSRAT